MDGGYVGYKRLLLFSLIYNNYNSAILVSLKFQKTRCCMFPFLWWIHR